MADQGKQVELASAYYAKGRKLWTEGGESKDEALVMFRKALAVQESVLGTYHKHTARTYYWIGFALKSRKDYDKAIVAYRRTLKIRLSLFGEDDLSTEDVHRAVADVLKEKGFDEKATEDYYRAVADSVRFEENANGFFDKGAYEKAVAEYQKCLEIEEAALGKYPLDIAAIYSRIAEVFKIQGEHDMAIVTYRDSLTIYEAKLGKEHPDTIKTLEGIELAVHLSGLNDEAAQKYRDSVSQSIKLVNDGNDLATKGKFDQALGKYDEALNIEESILGKYPLSTAEIYKRSALAFRGTGKYDRAIQALRTSLSIFVYEFGSDHANVIATLKEIGHTIMQQGLEHSAQNKYLNTLVYSVKYERYGDHILKQGDYTGAIEEFQKSLALEVSALGKFHLTQAALYRKIAEALRGQERLDFAIVNHRHALGIFQSQLGKDHPDTNSALDEAADTVRAKGLSDEEVAKYRESISRSVQLERKGNYLFAGGDQENALLQYSKAISFEEEHLGRFHLCTADLYYKIASTLKEKRKYDRALVKYRDVFALYQLSLGQDHPNTQKAYEELGLVARLRGLGDEEALKYSTLASNSIQYEKIGDDLVAKECYDQGVVEYRCALEIEESGLGKFHLTTAAIYSKIADAYRLQGQYNRSILEYRQALKIFESKLGSGHPDSSKSLEHVGLAVEGLGFKAEYGRRYQKAVTRSIHHERRGDKFQTDRNHGKAVNEYRQAIALEEEIFGKLHPATTELLKKIAAICRDQEDYDSALLVYSKVLAINEAALGKDNAETIRSFNDVSVVAQKQAGASGSTLEGWTTLNYILLGLIGMLILILNAAKALSTKERPLRNMKMPLYDVEIEDSMSVVNETIEFELPDVEEQEGNENTATRGHEVDEDASIVTRDDQVDEDASIVTRDDHVDEDASEGRRRSLEPLSEKLSEGGVGIHASLLSENGSDLETKSAVNGEDLLSMSVVNETIEFELPDVEEQEGNENIATRDDQVDEDASIVTRDDHVDEDASEGRRRSLEPLSEKLSEGGVGIHASLLSENGSDLVTKSAVNGEDLLSMNVVNETNEFELPDVEEQEGNENIAARDDQVDEDASIVTRDDHVDEDASEGRRRSLEPLSEKLSEGGVGIHASLLSENGSDLEPKSAVNGEDLLSMNVVNETIEFELPDVEEQEGNENIAARDYQVDEDASMDGSDRLVENEAPESMPKDNPSGKTDKGDEKPDAGTNPSGGQAFRGGPVEGKVADASEDGGVIQQKQVEEPLEVEPGAIVTSHRNPSEEVDGKKLSEAAVTADASEDGGATESLSQTDATSESETKEERGATLQTDSHDDTDEGPVPAPSRMKSLWKHLAEAQQSSSSGLEGQTDTPVDPTTDPPKPHTPPRKSWAQSTPSANWAQVTPSVKVPEESTAQAAKTVVDEEEPVISVADRLKALKNRLETSENRPAAVSLLAQGKKSASHQAS